MTPHDVIGQTQRGSRGTAPNHSQSGARWRWVVNATPRPLYPWERDPVPIVQEAGWAPGPVWTAWKNSPHLDSIPGSAHSESLHPLIYPGSLTYKMQVHLNQEYKYKL